MKLVRTRSYAKALKRLARLGASASDIRTMEDAISASPATGDMIPGGHGLRKARFGYGNVGESGGGRTIYYAQLEDYLFLITAHAKVDQADLTKGDLQLLAPW